MIRFFFHEYTQLFLRLIEQNTCYLILAAIIIDSKDLERKNTH